MAPGIFESAFDSMTNFALEQIGMDPEFVADYVNWENVRHNFNFDKVDKDAAKKVLDLTGRHAFREVLRGGKAIADRVMEGVEIGAGVTGQWWAAGLTYGAEKIMDYGEQYFESWMGWDEDDKPEKGHWVLIDEGTRRRRRVFGDFEASTLFGEDDEVSEEAQEAAALRNKPLPEMAPKDDLQREMTLAFTISAAADGHIKVVDEHMDVRYPRLSEVVQLKPEMEASLNSNSNTERMREIAAHHHEGLHKPLDEKIQARIGEQVEVDGERWTVVTGTNYEKVVVERNGAHREMAWEDVKPAWNTGHKATTFRTAACPEDHGSSRRKLGQYDNENEMCPGGQHDFMQVGGFHTTQYVWLGNELVCIAAILGKDKVETWSAWDGSKRYPHVDELQPVSESLDSDPLFATFRKFVGYLDHEDALAHLPSQRYGSYCSPAERGSLTQNVAQQRRGKKPETVFKPLDEDYRYDTPGLAQRMDDERERYNKEAAAYENQPPPEKLQRSWEQMSLSSAGGYRYTPGREEGKGVNFVPILLGGALVAFALTR